MNDALVKKWMAENDIKPEALAFKIGVSYGTIRNIMAGKRPFRPTITVLASLMGVTEDELLNTKKTTTGGRKAASG